MKVLKLCATAGSKLLGALAALPEVAAEVLAPADDVELLAVTALLALIRPV